MRRSRKDPRAGRWARFQNTRFRDARRDFNGRANKEERSRMAVTGALLIAMLLMTPWVLKSFGFYGDSAEGFGLPDCVLFGGLLVMAAALGWVAFGKKFAARGGKGRERDDLGERKNTRHTGG
jgi:hypothetical protein